jgi:hypothetical protein
MFYWKKALVTRGNAQCQHATVTLTKGTSTSTEEVASNYPTVTGTFGYYKQVVALAKPEQGRKA